MLLAFVRRRGMRSSNGTARTKKPQPLWWVHWILDAFQGCSIASLAQSVVSTWLAGHEEDTQGELSKLYF